MSEHDALIRRLHGLGTAPLDEALADAHLAAMDDAVSAVPAARPRGRMVVAGAVVTGSLLLTGATAGAATGSLPSVVQDMAHSVMAKVGVEVPKSKAAQAKEKAKAKAKGAEARNATPGAGNAAVNGTERVTGEECTNVDGTPFTGTHGEYVAAHPDDPATPDVNEREVAAQSDCGKPVQTLTPGGGADGRKPADAGKPAYAGNDDERTPATGKPADAGKPDASGKSNERRPTTTTTTVASED